MLRVSVLAILAVADAQTDTASADFGTSHYYYAARLIGALVIATVVPLLIDRRARRSSRAPH